jgi:DNA helicase IV
LIAKIEKNPHLNLYGDVNQDILKYIDKKSIIGLNNLIKEIISTNDVLNYKLEENYRNSKQITNYCNQFLSNKMISMGINSDEVNIININKKEVYDNILQNFNNKDIVIITKDSDLEEKLRSNNYEVYSVKTAKGLEFSKVLVIEEELNLTEKYVAYTRTLDKLFIYKINE